MNRSADVLLQLVRQEVLAPQAAEEPLLSSLPSIELETLCELFALAKNHDLTVLVGHALQKRELPGGNPIELLFRQELFNGRYHYEKMEFVFQTVCDAFAKAQIAHIPLKGAQMRRYYPQPWMRTSSDIDLLVRKEQFKQAEKILTSELGFSKKNETSHDVAFFSPDGVQFELHYGLIEEGVAVRANRVLERVWDRAAPTAPGSFLYEMDDAMFYFYHVAHLAKHFGKGGCGIKQFLDLQLLLEHGNNMRAAADPLLREGGLLVFDQAARELCEVWFAGRAHDFRSRQVERFVLEGGAYGSWEHYYLKNQKESGGKARYFLSRVFIPYAELKYQYPTIQKWPFLTPVFAVYRIFQHLFGKKRKYFRRHVDLAKTGAEAQADAVTSVLDLVGL